VRRLIQGREGGAQRPGRQAINIPLDALHGKLCTHHTASFSLCLTGTGAAFRVRSGAADQVILSLYTRPSVFSKAHHLPRL
jgi:hypothetical protein